MPVPELLMLYGRTDLLVAVGDQQPPTATPAWHAAGRHRTVTRTIAFHYTHGWRISPWQTDQKAWFGTTFNIDLDGTLYQCEDMRVWTNHVLGAPDFSGTYSFVNATSIGVELGRFGQIVRKGEGYKISSYGFEFEAVADPVDVCDYGAHYPGARPGRFSLKKMPPATVVRSKKSPWYYAKVASFADDRNGKRGEFPLDVLFTEEQYATLVRWAKSMCEMHRIPKSFLRHPTTGQEQPWLFVTDLIESGAGTTARVDENKKRVKAFQGIIGHQNIQQNRTDPGPSMDFYRVKRGISDGWWYPVDLAGRERALGYVTDRVADYMAMTSYDAQELLPRYYELIEGSRGGHFPIGSNRLWHGGIHLSPGGPQGVYAMANGRIVAARVANPPTAAGERALEYSTCFVLVHHDVHVRNVGDEIDYGADSTETVYSLYMHLAPLEVPSVCPFPVDYAAFPVWFNHYMIDNPDDVAPHDGAIFYPDQTVLLGDHLGRVGTYVVGSTVAGASYGPAIHVEVFTSANVGGFAGSPWQEARNRVEDNSPDLVCELASLNAWLGDRGNPGIDDADVLAAISGMRELAVRHRSEWTLTGPEQLSPQVPAGAPVTLVEVDELFPDDSWEHDVEPLCFHTEMVNGGALASVIGPFLESPVVWHLHPLVFMKWMNERVATHERILRSQDKRSGRMASTVRVTGGYVTEFVAPVASAAPRAGYPEVVWSDCTYGIRVNQIADAQALVTAPQTRTRFHLRLLDTIDQINDRPHGLVVLLSYAPAAASVHAARHAAGHAVDIRPVQASLAAQWYGFFQVVAGALEYIVGRDGAGSIALEMLEDPDGTNLPLVEPTGASREWLRRLHVASEATDPGLVAEDPAFPGLSARIGRMRLHLSVLG